MNALNYHHLRYFWAVARDGNLSRAAARLRVSQSALSSQIRALEASLGSELFARKGRGLTLTEAGVLALQHADTIFARGEELTATLATGRPASVPLRVGAVATLSRNFQESFVLPLLADPAARLQLRSGQIDQLLEALANHVLDVVLTNEPVVARGGPPWRSRRIARQRVSIVGAAGQPAFPFGRSISKRRIVVPGPNSVVRRELDSLCEQRGIKLDIVAEVDDMATIRLLARDAKTLALVPSVVVRDEIRAGLLRQLCVVPGLYETFHAVTVDRQYPHPRLAALLEREECDYLAPA